MPFLLKDRDISSDITGIRSVLIVPCRFCPAASFAVREKKPYIELFRRFLRTAPYESYIQALRSRLENEGVRTGVFDTKSPNQFVLCMWPAQRRRKLARRATGYDAVIVLGCDAAVEAARHSVESNSCRIIPGMTAEGVMNIIPTVRFPFKIWLDVVSVSRVFASS